MSSNQITSINRIQKLEKPSDYRRWKRYILAYISHEDTFHKFLDDRPETGARVQTGWDTFNAKARSNIILTLGAHVLNKVTALIHDHTTTSKEICDELARIHTVQSSQEIINLQEKLEKLKFDESKCFDDHVSAFLAIVDELSMLEEYLDEKAKVTKMLRSLPESFDSLAMAVTVNDMTFSNLIALVHANIARRKSRNKDIGNDYALQTRSAVQANIAFGPGEKDNRFDNGGFNVIFRGRGRGQGDRGCRGRVGFGRGRGDRFSDPRPCHYCGKPGHFIKFCRMRLADEHSGRIAGPSQGRGRGGIVSQHLQPHHINQQHGNYQQQPNSFSSGNISQGGPSSTPYQANFFQAPVVFDGPPPPPYYQDIHQACMARYVSKVATVGESKTNDAFIDSGATHHFFHRRDSFKTYNEITIEKVETASGHSRLLGKGAVQLPIGKGVIVEAFHAPDFTSNIVANHLLSELFNLFSTSDDNGENKRCEILKKSSKIDVVLMVPCIAGLYPIKAVGYKKSVKVSKSYTSNDFNTRHEKTGHIGIDRYRKLADQLDDVPHFEPTVMKQFECIPCLTAKMKKAPVHPNPSATHDGEIHFDLSVPVATALGGNTYAAHFLEPRSGKSDVIPIAKKSDLPALIISLKRMVEERYRVKVLRCDRAKENYPAEVVMFNTQRGINTEFSPAYAPESNGTAERLVQENWTRARVLLHGTNLPFFLWGEALKHANWLRNRTPSQRIYGAIPMMKWNKNIRIDFNSLLTFGQVGYAYKYYPRTQPAQKLLPRSEFCHFVGMESECRLVRVFVPATNTIRTVRRGDFHPVKGNALPSITSLLEGLAREKQLEEDSQQLTPDDVEDALARCMAAIHHHTGIVEYTKYIDCKNYGINLTPHKTNQGISDGPPLPKAFTDACCHPHWAAAIDREFKALVDRGTWEYVPRTPDMQPVPFKWAFRTKQVNQAGTDFLFKARCNLRGDKQIAYDSFDPEGIYAPVAAHETIRMLLAVAAALGLRVEGSDVSNAYLYGLLDIPIIMMQPTDSSGIERFPGMVCLLRRSLYGARQAGKIWGTVLHDTLLRFGFTPSTVESRLYFINRNGSLIILVVVVDDIMYATNDHTFLNELKMHLSTNFDVKHYGQLSSFIRWEINRSTAGIRVTQTQYCDRLLVRFGLANCNPVLTPLGSTADLRSLHGSEVKLSEKDHHLYRSMVGGVAYLATCTRPDISYAVSVLSRNLHCPTHRHLLHAKRLLRYISGTRTHGLFFPSDSQQTQLHAATSHAFQSPMHAAVDADWGGDQDTRRSTTGFIIAINAAPIFWRSKRQSLITLSSGESEYVALSTYAREVCWLRKMLLEMSTQKPWSNSMQSTPVIVDVDSTAAISMAQREDSTSRTKHIELKYHHVKELVQSGVIDLEKVDTSNQVADCLTKIGTIRSIGTMVTACHIEDRS